MRLHALAPGKVNLCLFLGGVRADGRHELVTLFESVSLADELELASAVGSSNDEVLCPYVDGPNLVAQALAALRANGWDAPLVRVRIEKRIPVAAGMGGGSADAAALLRMASWVEGLPDDVLQQIAAELGADVPSQLAPGLALGLGAGEQVEPRPAIARHAFVIVPQPYELATAEVYREADRLGLPRAAGELAGKRDDLLRALAPASQLPDELLVNDLQPAALSLCPQIKAALAALRDAGADRSFVCGSGPTVAGLFWGSESRDRAARAAARLTPSFPGARAVEPVGAEFGSPEFA